MKNKTLKELEFIEIKYKTLKELENVKEITERLIIQSKSMLQMFPTAKDYINGKIDAFNLLKYYVEERIKDNEI